jgi:hypothetical protein
VSRYSMKGPKHHENGKSKRFANAERPNETTISATHKKSPSTLLPVRTGPGKPRNLGYPDPGESPQPLTGCPDQDAPPPEQTRAHRKGASSATPERTNRLAMRPSNRQAVSLMLTPRGKAVSWGPAGKAPGEVPWLIACRTCQEAVYSRELWKPGLNRELWRGLAV